MAKLIDGCDYYEVLHVSRDAPTEIIRGCYRTLMQKLKKHPDLGGDTATAALINEAYAVLADVERRSEYDARLDVMTQVAQSTPARSPDPEVAAMTKRTPDLSRQCFFCDTPHDHGKIEEVDVTCHICGSPLSVAENRRIESDGQRAIARLDKKQKITFYTHWPQPRGFESYTEDISLNGLRLVTTRNLTEGQRIKIISEVLEAVAIVTRCVHERRGRTRMCVAGVSFATLRFIQSRGGFVSDHV
jgi:DnaJ-like protein/PilZ domain-containing protein